MGRNRWLGRRGLRAPRVGPRTLAARRAQRVTLRFPVPAELVELVRFGNEHPELVHPRFWQRVEDRFAALVAGEVPAGSSGVRVLLDERRIQVVLSFRSGSHADVQ